MQKGNVKMNWKKWAGILVFLMIIGFIGYSVLNTSQVEQLPTVRTAEVTENDITDVVSVTGVIEPSETQEIVGQGPVAELNVSIGDTIEESETLITYADGTSFEASFNGTITQINVIEGEIDNTLQQGLPSLVLADLNELQVNIGLSRADADLIELDQPVTLTYGDYTYEGTVSEIDPVASEDQSSSLGMGGSSNTTLGAVITFDTDADNLIAGFDIDADITVSSVENAIVLPIEALNYDEDNNPFVYVVENNVAHERTIETGIQSNVEIEVIDGLETGETVILSPAEDINDGTEVETE